MVRVFFTHVYVIVMAIIVVMTGNILANRFGDDIVNSLSSLVSSADDSVTDMQEKVKDWNKNVLD